MSQKEKLKGSGRSASMRKKENVKNTHTHTHTPSYSLYPKLLFDLKSRVDKYIIAGLTGT